MERVSLRQQQQRLREDVILQAVNALLADKGYDLMTVDEVAALVGIAKASLYKHFPSKEALAAAALVRLLDRTLEIIDAQPATAAPVDKLRAVVRWALREHLRGQMPTVPSGRSALRDTLAAHGLRYDRDPVYRDFRAGDVRHSQADVSKSGRLLGYVPRVTMKEGVALAMPWYLQRLG